MRTALLLLIVSLFAFHSSAQTAVQYHGALSVVGSQIVNQHGQAVSFAGASLFWSNNNWGGEAFYNASTVNWLKDDWNIEIVRAAMGVEDSGGYISDSTSNKAKVKTVVNAAINEGVYVIIDWHSHHAENYQTEAIEFFEEMATLYGQYDNVIYEIYNEPLQVSWDNVIKPYANAVIAAIRAIDSTNLIIVGTPTWSQDVDVAAMNPITGYANIAYTLHFYAATHGQWLRNKATAALNNGIALMVTEWGTVSANGNGAVDSVSTADWMNFLCNNHLSHCNWAVNDKVEGASALVNGASTLGNWSSNDLTPSGTLVRKIVQDWNLNCNDTVMLSTSPIPSTASVLSVEPFPNPVRASNLMELRINNSMPQSIEVQWCTSWGAILSKEVRQVSEGISNLKIHTPTVAAGIYFLIIATKEGRSVQKISVQ
ncbi:cellulase family glycosylhydrolase [Aureispira sp. CCB-E]|uniref:cellulase family glycosylhydrolase n=1 Tax=Aureispira sp. CCB-E TaxID=3051121 RepID=UPI0028688482|nr:cellulase family glycosylhydrolase [Aureispira sp. CCB-E]WMX16498.1 cellulase family glycosylhydrolase [Aureispira sp. CCB-E]